MPEVAYTLTMNDGSILEDCQCGSYENYLDCTIKGLTFGEAYSHFSDVSKYGTIIFEIEEPYFIDRTTYTGMNKLVSITQRNNFIEIYLEGTEIVVTHERRLKEVDSEDATIYNPDPNES